MSRLAWIAIFTALILTSGCAGLQPGYETPAVNVTSFKALSSEGMAPRFEIGLHVTNPNRSSLALLGLAYTLKIEGHKILTGVANALPEIEPYGGVDLTLTAIPSLFSSITLVVDLLQQQQDSLSYDLDIKLDPGGFKPNIHVRKKGDFALEKSGG